MLSPERLNAMLAVERERVLARRQHAEREKAKLQACLQAEEEPEQEQQEQKPMPQHMQHSEARLEEDRLHKLRMERSGEVAEAWWRKQEELEEQRELAELMADAENRRPGMDPRTQNKGGDDPKGKGKSPQGKSTKGKGQNKSGDDPKGRGKSPQGKSAKGKGQNKSGDDPKGKGKGKGYAKGNDEDFPKGKGKGKGKGQRLRQGQQ